MAKKRKHKKKRLSKHRATSSSDVSFDRLLQDLQDFAGQGRVRRAFAIAGRLVGHPEFAPSHVEAVVRVHEQRFHEMLKSGHAKKAAEMIERAVAQHPDWRPAFDSNTLAHAAIIGGDPAILLSYPNDAATAATIDSLLCHNIRDLRPLARHPGLSDEHPLKAAAATVIDAWEEIEHDGRRGSAYERMTRTVNRRSPFIGWRLFVRALSAFYEGNDDIARECLQRCMSCGNVQSMAKLLISLIDGTPPASDIGRRVLRATAADDFVPDLNIIDQYIDKNDFPEAGNAMRGLVRDPGLRRRPSLRIDIAALFLSRCLDKADTPPIIASEALGSATLMEDAFLRLDMMDGNDDMRDWKDYLKRHRSLPPIDRAVICNRMASLAVNQDPMTDVQSMLGGRFDDFMSDAFIPDDPEDYLEESIAHYPLAKTFRLWHGYVRERDNPKATEKILTEWHRHFPEDETPLLLLVDSCRARNVYQKAMSFFSKVDALGKGRPEVEAIRHYLTIDNACRDFSKGRTPKACDLLDTIPDDADTFVLTIRATLRWIAERDTNLHEANVEEANAEQELVDLGQPLALLCLPYLLAERNIPFRFETLPGRLQAQTEDADLMLQNLQYLVTVRDPIWNPSVVASGQLQLTDAIRNTNVDSRVLRDCLTGLVDFRGKITDVYLAPLWLLTAVGAARNDEYISTFLCYRAFLIRTSDRRTPPAVDAKGSVYGKRILDCLSAAYRTASKHGSIEDVRLVEIIAEQIGDFCCEHRAASLKPRAIAKIVKREAKTLCAADLSHASLRLTSRKR